MIARPCPAYVAPCPAYVTLGRWPNFAELRACIERELCRPGPIAFNASTAQYWRTCIAAADC